MTQPTNERPDADGSGWTTQAPGTPASAPQQPGAEPVAPWAQQAPSAPPAPATQAPATQAPATQAPAAPAAAPRREWPFAPQAPAGWAEPSGTPSERTLASVGAPAPAAAAAPTAPLPPYGGSPYGRSDLGYGAPTNPTLPLSSDARPAVDVTPPPYVPDAPTGRDRKRGERRGPGWLALIGVSLTTAALSCAATVGLTNDDSPSTATPTAQQSQSAPVVTGSSDTSPDWKTVAKAVAPSVVAVQVTTDQGGGQGSGIIYDTKGDIVTNNHVVADANKVVVVLADGREFDATVVGTDPSTDLAVIRISNPPSDLTAAAFGNSDAVTVGSPVMAIGNPLGLSDTVTTGIVSAVNRPVTAQAESGSGGDGSVTNAIQTDASINPGNSGGALLDAQGRVIGITSSIATLGSGSMFPGQSGQSGSIGLGFAIPSDEAKSVADQLIASNGKTVEHAWLGVKLKEGTVTLDGARRKAAILSEITKGGPADKAGLKSGDAVIFVNKELVAGADSLVAQVREKRAKDTVVVTVVRDGKSQDVTVTLGVRPANLG